MLSGNGECEHDRLKMCDPCCVCSRLEVEALKSHLQTAREALEKIAFGSLEKNFKEITELTDVDIALSALSKIDGSEKNVTK